MIVEFVGPSACGKTTLAAALAEALRLRGDAVRLVSSARPSESEDVLRGRAAPPGSVAAVVSRAAKAMSLVPAIVHAPARESLADDLIRLMPQRNPLWGWRHRRYLGLLARDWEMARRSADVHVFDQGYHCALCALLATATVLDAGAAGRALQLVPQPDLLVRVVTSPPTVASRLAQRLERQSALERLFELDRATTLGQIKILDRLAALRSPHASATISVSAEADALRSDAIQAILEAIDAQHRGPRPAPTECRLPEALHSVWPAAAPPARRGETWGGKPW
jgi:energy-coupling factor transporter ATP-binding protein EcfA2